MTDWIDLGPPATRVMNSIGFDDFFYKLFLFNYMIKIDAYKIEHQSKNRYLFEIIIIIESK
jgi:hypothetical protein